MNERLGFIGIVLENRNQANEVNRILSSYGDIIRGRIGVPDVETGVSVIGIIVWGNDKQVGSLTGKLGNLPEVTVKSAMTQKTSSKKME